jgi:hypothetical protein
MEPMQILAVAVISGDGFADFSPDMVWAYTEAAEDG